MRKLTADPQALFRYRGLPPVVIATLMAVFLNLILPKEEK